MRALTWYGKHPPIRFLTSALKQHIALHRPRVPNAPCVTQASKHAVFNAHHIRKAEGRGRSWPAPGDKGTIPRSELGAMAWQEEGRRGARCAHAMVALRPVVLVLRYQ